MKKSSTVLRVGARSSRLSLLQSEKGLFRLKEELSIDSTLPVSFKLLGFSSPGDRDKQMDLHNSPEDFFTRDLDNALLDGTLDAAIHSAKDLPENCPDGIDWFWLPWRADPRDVLVAPLGKAVPLKGTVGVSSQRRGDYCRNFHPGLKQKVLRGTMEERLEQLDRGDFDVIVTAAAAMERLGWENRITAYIHEQDLAVPEGQGYLALTFRQGDARFENIRSLFTKSVRFVGAGPGRAGLCSVEGLDDIRNCDICFYDALMDQSLTDYCKNAVYTGKRSRSHSHHQEEISRMILDAARQGKKVVRLKGGDPGIFGRLKEETDLLDAHGLPYRVLPGISSMSAATTGTGMLLTKRGSHRGFTALTPRIAGGGCHSAGVDIRAALPIVLFMSIKQAAPVLQELKSEGRSVNEPAAAVFDAGSESPLILRSSLGALAGELEALDSSSPGLIIIGEAAADSFGSWGALKGERVLLTSSETLISDAREKVIDLGGHPLVHPLITLTSTKAELDDVCDFDWICLTSPSSARFFLAELKAQSVDIRSLPSLMVCGRRTAAPLEEAGLFPDICPEKNFSAKGMLEEVKKWNLGNARILKLSSDRGGQKLADDLKSLGLELTDRVLYRNNNREAGTLPSFDSVVFTSSSGVFSFIKQYGVDALDGHNIAVIGQPTAESLSSRGIEDFVISREATVQSAVEALALARVHRALEL